jgi:hypothetical protein
MKKFHREDCVHRDLGFAFWCECPRHGQYYFLCGECNIEELKDYMVEFGYLPYEKVKYMSEGDVLGDKGFRKFVEKKTKK